MKGRKTPSSVPRTKPAGVASAAPDVAAPRIQFFYEPSDDQLLVIPGAGERDLQLEAMVGDNLQQVIRERATTVGQSLADIAKAVHGSGLVCTFVGRFKDLEPLVSQLRRLVLQIWTGAYLNPGEEVRAGDTDDARFGFALRAWWTTLEPIGAVVAPEEEKIAGRESFSGTLPRQVTRRRAPSPAGPDHAVSVPGAGTETTELQGKLNELGARFQAYQNEMRRGLAELFRYLDGQTFSDGEAKRRVALAIRDDLRQAKLAIKCPKCSQPGIIDIAEVGRPRKDRFVVRHGQGTCTLSQEQFPSIHLADPPPTRPRRSRRQPNKSSA